MNRINLREPHIEPSSAEFSSRGKKWVLGRDWIGNITTSSPNSSELITDEELVSMDIGNLAVLLESSGW